MKKRIWLAAWLLASCLTLCSCGLSPMERQTFAICMSIDLSAAQQLTVGIQAPKNGASEGDSGAGDYEVLTASGKTMAEALALLAASTPYPINYCQLKLCLLSYELASKTELRPMLEELEALPTMRPNATVMIALGNAEQVMQSQKADFGMRLSTHLNLLLERLRGESMLPDSTLATVVRQLGDDFSDPLLCVCAVNAQLLPKEKKPPSGSSGSEGSGGNGGGGGSSTAAFALGEPWSTMLLPDGLLAGTLPRTGTNAVEYLGSAAVGNGRVSGVLTAKETQLALRALAKAKRKVAVNGGEAQLQLWLAGDQELLENSEALTALVQKLQALHCDALRFGEACCTLFYTNAAWERFDFHHRYPTAAFVVNASQN
ncbi:MAG: hypothetical protein RSA65_00780 [Clostridia bacterium]